MSSQFFILCVLLSRLSEPQGSPLDRPGLRLTSLSALYQPAFKPFFFSHMYNTKYNADFEGRYMPPPLPDR